MTNEISIDSTPYCYDKNQLSLIQEISTRVQEMRKGGRLTPEVLNTIRKYFRIKNIYHSNAIEGNLLNVGETRQIIEFGLTITGKPLKDQAEAKNLSEAITFLEELAANTSTPITESEIRQIHYLVLKGIDDLNAGKYRSVIVEIGGSKYKPPSPESVPGQMQSFSEWLKNASIPENGLGTVDGLINAAIAHCWLVYIHPFVDGNGRVARLLMNLMLMRFGYPIAIISREDRLRYYDALELSQDSDLSGFLALLIECIHESLEEYESAAREQRERTEWAESLAQRFTERERIRTANEYEVWKSAMELLKSYFRQTAGLIDESAKLGKVFFRDFGTLELQKYINLKIGESAKKTWFFRIDFLCGNITMRYLFFFGSHSYQLRNSTDVTLHISREEPAGSFNYQRLDQILSKDVPSIVEIGYRSSEERFIIRSKSNTIEMDKLEAIGQKFFDEVIKHHFNN